MGTKVGRSIASKHKYTGTPDGQKYIDDTIQNASAHVKNFLPAVMKLMRVQGNPTAVQSIGAQNYSAIMSQVSSFFSSAGASQQEKLEFDCELLLITPNNELTEAQLIKKELCIELEALVDEEIRTGTVNNDVVVDVSIGQEGAADFANSQSGLSLTLEAMSTLTADVSEQTTYRSNNFTHFSDEDTIKWYSNAISNTAFLTFTSAGYVSGMKMAEEFIAASTLSAGDLCYLDASGEMDLADADAETTADTLLAVATEAITIATSGTFLLMGKYTTTGLTTGSVYYVSTTAGDWTLTKPSVIGDIVRIVGYALSTTDLYFKPDGTYVEIA